MEEIKHGDLFNYIMQEKTLNQIKCFHIMHQILLTVYDLHEKYSIVHCDLKPNNILIHYNDYYDPLHQFPIIKIIDFGMSHFLKPFRYLNQLCGSPYYTAPEICVHRKYNHAVDCWSVGIIMFFSLFVYFPFSVNPNFYNTHSKHIQAIYAKIKLGFQPIIKRTSKYGYGNWFPDHIPISNDAQDLISQFLIADSNLRITAYEALNHPWIKKYLTQEERVLEKLGRLSSSNDSTSTLTFSETASIGGLNFAHENDNDSK